MNIDGYFSKIRMERLKKQNPMPFNKPIQEGTEGDFLDTIALYKALESQGIDVPMLAHALEMLKGFQPDMPENVKIYIDTLAKQLNK